MLNANRQCKRHLLQKSISIPCFQNRQPYLVWNLFYVKVFLYVQTGNVAKNQNFKIINSSKQLRNYRNCKKWIKGQRHPIISINVWHLYAFIWLVLKEQFLFFVIQNFSPVKEVYNKEKCLVVKSPIELSPMSKLGKLCFLERGKWPCVTTSNCFAWKQSKILNIEFWPFYYNLFRRILWDRKWYLNLIYKQIQLKDCMRISVYLEQEHLKLWGNYTKRDCPQCWQDFQVSSFAFCIVWWGEGSINQGKWGNVTEILETIYLPS